MINNRKTIFISDLHLEPIRSDIVQQLTYLIKNCDSSVDGLYILGDLFETWIGDDDDTLFHRQIIEMFKKTTQRGLKIYFTHGNRDFLIGKKFLRETGCVLLPTEKKISLYGTDILLMHGDTLCTRDHAYLKARKLGHNWFLQSLFLLMPLSLRRKFADKMRAKSLRHTQSTAKEIMDVTQDEVERVMQKHHVKYLIHGHTHKPDIHYFSLNNLPAQRIVLSAWHDRGRALIWHESGKIETISLQSQGLITNHDTA